MSKVKCLNSNMLKCLAMIFMLLDHLWATIVPGNQWMTIVGRMAFPIFAFLLVEGYIHTSDVKKYKKRLVFFGLISEIPFNLIMTSSVIFPFHQNVMFTLLLGLLTIDELEYMRQNKNVKTVGITILKVTLYLLLGIIGFVDYGATGILTILAFYLFRNFKLAWIGQFISLLLIFVIFFKGQSVVIPLFGTEYFFPLQGFGILSLIPIWLYNGERGKKSKAIQYGFYLFYPVHMLVLYLVYRFLF
ncbi:MAG: conjugal transfer protein TraX [Lachnospiraceae bacterium]|nr:conjugal transfer protein TraX [Lachnospiraceae bacterium]